MKAEPAVPPWAEDDDDEAGGQAEKKRRESQATALVRLATASGAEFFRDAHGEAFAAIVRDGHSQTHPLRAKAARAWLARTFYHATGKAPSSTALADALNALEGAALFDGAEHPVSVRVAEHDGGLYIDSGRDDFAVFEVRPDGWRVLAEAPAAVRFRRPRGLAPLPLPTRHGRLCELREFLNVRDDDDFALIAAFIVAACRPSVPQPLLALMGEQGSGKSVLARAIRSCLDPSSAPLRSEPKEPRDLAVAGANTYIVALDNASHLPPWLSDCLCRLSSGGAFSTRELYTNADEVVFDAIRPVILTSIESLLVRGDLADRALVVEVPVLPDAQRVPEREYWRAFADAQPRILAGVLDAAAAGLAGVESVRLESWPRLADFTAFAVAAEAAGQWPAGAFLQAYRGNRQRSAEAVLDGDVIAAAVRQLGRFEGSAGELLERLGHAVPMKPRAWPQSPRVLSNMLRRLQPALRRAGVSVRFERYREGRLVVIESSAEAAQTAEPAPAMHDEPAEDAADDEAPSLWRLPAR